ncbi:helicase-primase helicase subunit [Aotine betaherpesvirus 1]|uniref:Helicase-primase helicase subunit n=1 Tax=Aotine betaherpesvirus 1 TaxID=50290 RepID=G8XUG9_9BETA|nr:helicase-primase helicase subunit [Aotine betaherpesvirus 1]AEV80799.1 helicase-primase helicase subunit [Aotine betaherpesvirus 1]
MSIMGTEDADSAFRSRRYEDSLILNLSSAAKIERIVDQVKSLAGCRFEPEDLPPQWYRSISRSIRPEELGGGGSGGNNGQHRNGNGANGNDGYRRNGNGVSWNSVGATATATNSGTEDVRVPCVDQIPFLPFRVLLITGTAGAGKTSSIQVLAANLDCVVTGTTVIAAQNLSSVLNRTRAAQIKTIYRAFGFNSKHVHLSDGAGTFYQRYRVCEPSEEDTIHKLQLNDLVGYWPVIADIVDRHLNMVDKKANLDGISELCESNIIVIDECGVLLRHMLQVVVFFYYFYNAIAETRLYRERRIPCLVCVGSPTQTEALESRYDHHRQNKNVQRGVDVLSALICNKVLMEYCDIARNWIMFINNKRCTDLDFGDLLKYMEFGIPLKEEHVGYVDRFVRPPNLIRNPSYASDMTRLFLSHAEVQAYFKRLHDQIRVSERHRLFDLPVYCVVNNRNYEELCELTDPLSEPPRIEAWFRSNLARIINYSQFVDHNLSSEITTEVLQSAAAAAAAQTVGEGGGEEDLGAGDESGDGSYPETLLTLHITYIKGSSIGVNSKVKACVVGYHGTFESFIEILRKDTFIERTPCEQAGYAYSLISGLLFSAMYLFYTSKHTTEDVLREISRIQLPDIPALCGQVDEATYNAFEDEGGSSSCSAGEEVHDIPCLSSENAWPEDENELSDHDLLAVDTFADPFFLKYTKPPLTGMLSFEETVYIYTTFRDIFLQRYQIMMRRTGGEFAKCTMIAYNRRNVITKENCQIVSQTGSFVGMLSSVSPAQTYTLEGFTNDNVLSLPGDRHRIHPTVTARGLSRLVVRDALGFIYVLDVNVSRFVESAHGKSLHICTTVDYGITSRTAMTIAKSQGLSLEKVAIDFGDRPSNLKMSHIYVAMSRVTDPEQLIMNVNPMRLAYERNALITPYICRALKDPRTTLIF